MFRAIHERLRNASKRKSDRYSVHHKRRLLFEGLEHRQMMVGGLAASLNQVADLLLPDAVLADANASAADVAPATHQAASATPTQFASSEELKQYLVAMAVERFDYLFGTEFYQYDYPWIGRYGWYMFADVDGDGGIRNESTAQGMDLGGVQPEQFHQ